MYPIHIKRLDFFRSAPKQYNPRKNVPVKKSIYNQSEPGPENKNRKGLLFLFFSPLSFVVFYGVAISGSLEVGVEG